MKHVDFTPKGVCSRKISFDLTDDNRIENLCFMGGCSGNLLAISKLLQEYPADKAITILEGNCCGNKSTSCADQLTKALREAIKK